HSRSLFSSCLSDRPPYLPSFPTRRSSDLIFPTKFISSRSLHIRVGKPASDPIVRLPLLFLINVVNLTSLSCTFDKVGEIFHSVVKDASSFVCLPLNSKLEIDR